MFVLLQRTHLPLPRETTLKSWPAWTAGSLEDGQCVPSHLDGLTVYDANTWGPSHLCISWHTQCAMMELEQENHYTHCWKGENGRHGTVTGLTQWSIFWDRVSEDSLPLYRSKFLVISSVSPLLYSLEGPPLLIASCIPWDSIVPYSIFV